MTWTDERCNMLRSLWAGGFSASQIAAELGDLTRNAVIGKARRLGLEKREHGRNPLLKIRDHDSPPKRRRKPNRRLNPIVQIPRIALPSPLPFDGNPITLIDLTNHTCRWPINDDVRNMLYCGKPEADLECRKPYCDHHTQIAWRTNERDRTRHRELDAQ